MTQSKRFVRDELNNLISHGGPRPKVAIFDLDGTLFDVVYRSLNILKEFLAQETIQKSHPDLHATASKIGHANFLYSMENTLNAAGIDRYSEYSGEFLLAAEKFWFNRFFKDDYLKHDLPYEGAALCVNELSEAGCHIVYLSGRDVPSMRRGTLDSLKTHGFPIPGKAHQNVHLILKPDFKDDDLHFKKTAVETIATMGDVIFTIDNEPANVLMFQERFPKAWHIHFHTQFARALELAGPQLRIAHKFSELGYFW